MPFDTTRLAVAGPYVQHGARTEGFCRELSGARLTWAQVQLGRSLPGQVVLFAGSLWRLVLASARGTSSFLSANKLCSAAGSVLCTTSWIWAVPVCHHQARGCSVRPRGHPGVRWRLLGSACLAWLLTCVPMQRWFCTGLVPALVSDVGFAPWAPLELEAKL